METISAGITQLIASLPSPHHLLQIPLLLSSIAPLPDTQPPPNSQSSISLQSTCKTPSQSCPSTLPHPINTCCLNHPSGHFLLAQFWDTSPSLGPNDSWTLHGLWPDYCTGGYPANCDGTRSLTRHQISGIVNTASKTTHPDLEAYMNTYWKGLHGDDDLWSHEWNKHGTCVSTLEPRCYDDDDGYRTTTTTNGPPAHIDLLDYLSAATTLHSTLDTYTRLSTHGIVPSTTQTYTLSQITEALTLTLPPSIHQHQNQHPHQQSTFLTATIKCHHNALDEIWMHFTTTGPLRNISSSNVHDLFSPAAPDTIGRSTCPSTGIRYLPKHSTPRPTGTQTAIPGPTGTHAPNSPFRGRGFLNVHVLEDGSGSDADGYGSASVRNSCLIRQGQWFTSGQCARYRAKDDVTKIAASFESAAHKSHHPVNRGSSDGGNDEHLFTLSSSYAPCGIVSADSHISGGAKEGQFVCAQNLGAQDIFSASGSDGGSDEEAEKNVLMWKNQTIFYADRVPGRFEKVGIFTDDGEGSRNVKVEIRWEAV